jgi:hypothetical protein
MGDSGTLITDAGQKRLALANSLQKKLYLAASAVDKRVTGNGGDGRGQACLVRRFEV